MFRVLFFSLNLILSLGLSPIARGSCPSSEGGASKDSEGGASKGQNDLRKDAGASENEPRTRAEEPESSSKRILIMGKSEDNFGDYSKRAKTLSILRSAGYECRIFINPDDGESASIETRYLKNLGFSSGVDFISSLGETEIFIPDLFVVTPAEREKDELNKLVEIFKRPVIAIEEYGYKEHQEYKEGEGGLLRFYSSGMKGLGLILTPDAEGVSPEDPREYLKNLPKVYQEAIFQGDFQDFTASNDFYSGYASGPSAVSEMTFFIENRLRSDSKEEKRAKKMTFYFMGNSFEAVAKNFLEGKGRLLKRVLAPEKSFVKEVKITKIEKAEDGNYIAREYSSKSFEGEGRSREINFVFGFIDNKHVKFLIKAAKETLSTGDESFAEVYSARRFPLFYEQRSHKVQFQFDQFDYVENQLKQYISKQEFIQLSEVICDRYPKYGFLLDLKKKYPAAFESLVDSVHENLNFKKNVSKVISSLLKSQDLNDEKPEFMPDSKSWGVGKWFLLDEKKLDHFEVFEEISDMPTILYSINTDTEELKEWANYKFSISKNSCLGFKLARIEPIENN